MRTPEQIQELAMTETEEAHLSVATQMENLFQFTLERIGNRRVRTIDDQRKLHHILKVLHSIEPTVVEGAAAGEQSEAETAEGKAAAIGDAKRDEAAAKAETPPKVTPLPPLSLRHRPSVPELDSPSGRTVETVPAPATGTSP